MGETLEDLAEYAVAKGAEGYDIHELRLCRCAVCGGRVFAVHGDLEQRVAKRIRSGCGAEHYIVDSGKYGDPARLAIMVCECVGVADSGNEHHNVAVGYSLYADRAGIRAIGVTSRCMACGRLGDWLDWMVRTGGDAATGPGVGTVGRQAPSPAAIGPTAGPVADPDVRESLRGRHELRHSLLTR